MMAQALGLLVVAAALGLFLHQAQLVGLSIQRQFRAEDHLALEQALRAELRVAGHRFVSGPSPDHDTLRIEGPARNPTLQYLCDRCGATDSSRASSWRLLTGTLSFRHPGSNAHQALHDSRLSGLQAWDVEHTEGRECTPRVRVELQPALSSEPPLNIVARPRNLGLLVCERDQGAARSQTGGSSQAVR
jgi:hypothetical protein